MKNKVITILSILANIILVTILCNFIRINGSIIKEKQIIKEMSESTQVTDLNNQINALNTEHTEYMQYVQTCKTQLASTLTDIGIETSENANIDTMISNIRTISGKGGLISWTKNWSISGSNGSCSFSTSGMDTGNDLIPKKITITGKIGNTGAWMSPTVTVKVVADGTTIFTYSFKRGANALVSIDKEITFDTPYTNITASFSSGDSESSSSLTSVLYF